MSKRPV
jgi:hypothetical protein